MQQANKTEVDTLKALVASLTAENKDKNKQQQQ